MTNFLGVQSNGIPEYRMRGVVRQVSEARWNHWLEQRAFFQWYCRNPCRLLVLPWVRGRRRSGGLFVDLLSDHAARPKGKEATDRFGAFDKLVRGGGRATGVD